VRFFGRRLVKDVYRNLADRKRDKVRVWTMRAIDPGGEVYTEAWGDVRQHLANQLPDGFAQTIVRQPRKLGGTTPTWMWVCPQSEPDRAGPVLDNRRAKCLGRVYKLYCPLPPWTIPAAMGLIERDDAMGDAWRDVATHRFMCRNCAGLVYESSERNWRSGDARGSAAIAWDRFVQRMSMGVVRGRDVDSQWLENRL